MTGYTNVDVVIRFESTLVLELDHWTMQSHYLLHIIYKQLILYLQSLKQKNSQLMSLVAEMNMMTTEKQFEMYNVQQMEKDVRCFASYKGQSMWQQQTLYFTKHTSCSMLSVGA